MTEFLSAQTDRRRDLLEGSRGGLISFVTNVKSTKPRDADLNEILEDFIKDGKHGLAEHTARIQNLEDQPSKQVEEKEKLPMASFNGRFKGGVDLYHLDQPSRLATTDFDDFNSVEESKAAREKLKSCPFVVAAFISPRGGLKVIWRGMPIPRFTQVKKKKGQTYNNLVESIDADYKIMYEQGSKYLANFLDAEVDSASDLPRRTFLTHDPDIYINYDANDFLWSRKEERLCTVLNHLTVDPYPIWIRVGMSLFYAAGREQLSFDRGKSMWDAWSQRFEDYDPKMLSDKWDNGAFKNDKEGRKTTTSSFIKFIVDKFPHLEELIKDIKTPDDPNIKFRTERRVFCPREHHDEEGRPLPVETLAEATWAAVKDKVRYIDGMTCTLKGEDSNLWQVINPSTSHYIVYGAIKGILGCVTCVSDTQTIIHEKLVERDLGAQPLRDKWVYYDTDEDGKETLKISEFENLGDYENMTFSPREVTPDDLVLITEATADIPKLTSQKISFNSPEEEPLVVRETLRRVWLFDDERVERFRTTLLYALCGVPTKISVLLMESGTGKSSFKTMLDRALGRNRAKDAKGNLTGDFAAEQLLNCFIFIMDEMHRRRDLHECLGFTDGSSMQVNRKHQKAVQQEMTSSIFWMGSKSPYNLCTIDGMFRRLEVYSDIVGSGISKTETPKEDISYGLRIKSDEELDRFRKWILSADLSINLSHPTEAGAQRRKLFMLSSDPLYSYLYSQFRQAENPSPDERDWHPIEHIEESVKAALNKRLGKHFYYPGGSDIATSVEQTLKHMDYKISSYGGIKVTNTPFDLVPPKKANKKNEDDPEA